MSNATNNSSPRIHWTAVSFSWTWDQIVTHALKGFGGQATLSELYTVIEKHPRTKSREHWRPKVRQVLQQGRFVRVSPGVWALAVRHSKPGAAQSEQPRPER